VSGKTKTVKKGAAATDITVPAMQFAIMPSFTFSLLTCVF
jgi:hypothetical protein